MTTISGPVRFDFIKQRGRKFYLFSDIHDDYRGTCRKRTFQDTLKEFSKIGETFYYFLEIEPSQMGDMNLGFPLHHAREQLVKCKLRGECLPNIVYNWSDIRRSFVNMMKPVIEQEMSEIKRAASEARGIDYVLHRFLDLFEENPKDPTLQYFANSIAEFCEDFPSKFSKAMSLLEYEFSGNILYSGTDKNLWLMVFRTIMDLNLISRIEHINKDGSVPKNIIVYAGWGHILLLKYYLEEGKGIEEYLSYGTKIPTDPNPTRCIQLDRKLGDF